MPILELRLAWLLDTFPFSYMYMLNRESTQWLHERGQGLMQGFLLGGGNNYVLSVRCAYNLNFACHQDSFSRVAH